MKQLFFVAIGLVVLGGGCSSHRDDVASYSIWNLQSSDFASLTEEIPLWANEYFSEGVDGENAGTVPEELEVTGKFTLVEAFDIEVVDIPDGRRVKPYRKPQEPVSFAAFVLKDEAGELFRTYVQSKDGVNFRGEAFGPALDRQVVTNFSKEPLTTWPAPEIRSEAEKAGAQMVMIPYPYAMHQVYYQYGEDVQTAKFVYVESGEVYSGLDVLLDSIETDWESLN